jgi:hypothetical protein
VNFLEFTHSSGAMVYINFNCVEFVCPLPVQEKKNTSACTEIGLSSASSIHVQEAYQEVTSRIANEELARGSNG